MTLSSFFAASISIWFLVGVAWLLPQKLAIFKRVGNLTSNQLIQLAKAGDIEIQRLRRRTWWYVGIGLFLILPQVLLLQILKFHG